MNRIFREETILSGVILLMAAIAPSLFPAALAGVEKLDVTGKYLLIPSIIILFATLFFASARGHRRLSNRVWAGILAGFAGTLGLEVVRATSFRLGGMPGDMPRLLGVLLTDRFMYGPSMFSDILGWSYHFWNGISFAIIFAVLFGRPRMIGALRLRKDDLLDHHLCTWRSDQHQASDDVTLTGLLIVSQIGECSFT